MCQFNSGTLNSKSFATSAASVEVCVLPSADLVLVVFAAAVYVEAHRSFSAFCRQSLLPVDRKLTSPTAASSHDVPQSVGIAKPSSSCVVVRPYFPADKVRFICCMMCRTLKTFLFEQYSAHRAHWRRYFGDDVQYKLSLTFTCTVFC